MGNLHEFAELFGFDWHDDSDWTWHDVAVKMADELEQAIAATLGSDAKPCYATDYTHDNCKYSVNRGWVEDTRFYISKGSNGTCKNTYENRWFKCSACGYGITDLYADDESDIDEQPKYCPNCGAKVVG